MSGASSSTSRRPSNITFDARNFPPLSVDNPAARWSTGESVFWTLPEGGDSHFSNDDFIYTDPDIVQSLAQKFGVSLQQGQGEELKVSHPPVPTAAIPAPPEGIADTDDAIAVCLVPDVCWTPIGNTVVPIPYQVYGKASDDKNYSPDVFFNGCRAMRFDSQFSKTYGDEPGVALGVVSGTQGDIVEPTSHSCAVRINGHPAIRHGDSCTLNKGNTIGEIIFILNRMIFQPPLGDAKDAKEREESGESKAQYQRPSERGVGSNLTAGGTRTIGEEWSRQRNPDGTRSRSHTIHQDKREIQSPSAEAEYEFFNEKVGVVKDKLLVNGEYGNINLNALTAKGEASASAKFDESGVDVGVRAEAGASTIKVEGTAGNKYIAGQSSLEGPAGRIGGDAGLRVSNKGVDAKLEGEFGGVLIEGGAGLELASPTIFWGWGVYVGCEVAGNVGFRAKAGASLDTTGKRKSLALAAGASLGVGGRFKCNVGVHSDD